MSIPEGLDRIDLVGIRAHAHHGLFDFERRDGQTFVVDASIGLDLQTAARTGDLSASVHYGELAEQLHAALVDDPTDLIETVALRMLDTCLEHEQVRWASVTVHKPEAPIEVAFTDVAVTMERSRT
ncbi:dihydroneopterin aldolase [Aeromicrobium sp. IC_218]|uniref:dihydroneopterin aldolase n=1 Tax=Aeromicrobium sp. IC_218 TaxID=2545468 RepID=UPI0010386D5C|nr:dihydroneopterin aldolase [Aeromicrobium sp. IC_218]TCJ00752.1 dihydroneopterin aldolase [Aeromicrobium sp. IC_218]